MSNSPRLPVVAFFIKGLAWRCRCGARCKHGRRKSGASAKESQGKEPDLSGCGRNAH
jgi:hypothetical protein